MVTVQVTIASFLLSSIIGLAFALMMVSNVRAVALFGISAVNVIRGLPIIVQLFYIYFVLPEFGVQLTALQAGIIGLASPIRRTRQRTSAPRPRKPALVRFFIRTLWSRVLAVALIYFSLFNHMPICTNGHFIICLVVTMSSTQFFNIPCYFIVFNAYLLAEAPFSAEGCCCPFFVLYCVFHMSKLYSVTKYLYTYL